MRNGLSGLKPTLTLLVRNTLLRYSFDIGECDGVGRCSSLIRCVVTAWKVARSFVTRLAALDKLCRMVVVPEHFDYTRARN